MTITATSLGLPPECAPLRPLTQLWLASRLHSGTEWAEWRESTAKERAERREKRAAEEKEKEREEGSAGLGVEGEGEVGEKAVSRASTPTSTQLFPADPDPEQAEFDRVNITQAPFIPARESRAVSWKNLGLQLRIYAELWPRAVRIAKANPRLVVLAGVHLFGVVVEGLLPAAGLYCNATLLDLVDAAQGGVATTWAIAMGYALGAVVAEIGSQIHSLLFSRVESTLRSAVNIAADRIFIEGKLDLAQETEPNALQEALVSEAGQFAGWNQYEDERHSGAAWAKASSWTDFIRSTVDIGSQVALFLSTLRGPVWDGTLAGFITPTNTLVLAIAFLPQLLRMVTERMYGWYPTVDREVSYQEQRDRMEESALEKIISKREFHNELVLYGLKDWTVSRWDKLMTSPSANRPRWLRSTTFGYFVSMLEMGGSDLITNLLYVLIATRVIQTNLTLGRIQMCKGVGSTFIYGISLLKDQFRSAYQDGFLLAAVFSVAEGTQSLRPTINFEKHRVAGGMRIEARDLTFSYGAGQRPVLRNINLVVEPGESLAIVGFNGSGKTTLVKTLLGLHRYEGTLLVNNRSIRDYSLPSLHARMSCLFQDYVRYCLPLRDNVGIGDTTRIDDEDAVNIAIERGGAEGVRAKAGLDGWLVHSTEDIEELSYEGIGVESEDEEGGVSSEDEDDEDEDDEAEDNEADDHQAEDNEVISTEPTSKASESDVPQSNDPATNDPATNDPATNEPDVEDTLFDKPARFIALSGGQWQRVAISRAFMRAGSADLIVFDEPSAALDPRAEAALFDRIHSLSHAAHATTIFISHRFGTVRRADRIAFMDKGRIIEYGTHEELMALKGQYFECFDVQRRGFVDEA